jgi:hypothetical protein
MAPSSPRRDRERLRGRSRPQKGATHLEFLRWLVTFGSSNGWQFAFAPASPAPMGSPLFPAPGSRSKLFSYQAAALTGSRSSPRVPSSSLLGSGWRSVPSGRKETSDLSAVEVAQPEPEWEVLCTERKKSFGRQGLPEWPTSRGSRSPREHLMTADPMAESDERCSMPQTGLQRRVAS